MDNPPDPAPGGPEELLRLALSRPNEALARARALLAGGADPGDAAAAHQAIGTVLREFGDIDAAIGELRAAARLARVAGDRQRAADVQGTLGVALIFAGRTVAGRRALDASAAAAAGGPAPGRPLFRRGAVLLVLGRHREAMADLDAAVAALGLAGDRVWQARALSERAVCRLWTGSARRAEADLRRAGELFSAAGQELESADIQLHLGLLALRTGDLPVALARFDDAAVRYEHLGAPDYDLSVDRCAALLAAGLPQDATAEADRGLARMESSGARPTKRAELLLTAATCALAAGDPETALDRARNARRLFDRQRRPWWQAHARLAEVRARHAVGPATGTLLRAAERTAADLAGLASPDARLARLTAGRIALDLGRTPAAQQHLAAAAAGRRHGPALDRALGWLAQALAAQAAGDRRRSIGACRAGLLVIDQHRGLLGSSELRAQATAHGAELAGLGQRHALDLGRPRLLLAWSERWRAIALAVPPVRPPDDPGLTADLVAMREIASGLSLARVRGLPLAPLERELLRRERAVRHRSLRTVSRRPGPATPRFDVPALLAELGEDRLVELVDLDGELHALVCGGGRVSRIGCGSSAEAGREVTIARFALSRAAYGPAVGAARTGPADGVELLTALGRRLQARLLGAAADRLGRAGVVVVPPGRWHAVPWALAPALRDRDLTVAPSATAWLRARRSARAEPSPGTRPRRVVLVRGPGLESEGAEVPALAAAYRSDPGSAQVVVLENGAATVSRVLEAMEGADLVHVAAHGSFRADSPLFSALHLDDGPLTGYDLERLSTGPRRLVLSSCDSGVAAPAGADEVLGLASALLPLGTVGVVASVVPVNDAAVVPVMLALHDRLRQGAGLARALREARQAADPVQAATAWSFIALGAG